MRVLPNWSTVMVWICVLGVAIFGVVAIASSSVNEAGAASSGGTSTYSEGDEAEDDGDSADSGGGKYERIWDRTERRDKRWARKTAECESGKDPDAIGGGGLYRGAFQFMKSTWKSAPKSPGGDPIKYPYRTQAVVAVKLKKRDGAGHWPNCG